MSAALRRSRRTNGAMTRSAIFLYRGVRADSADALLWSEDTREPHQTTTCAEFRNARNLRANPGMPEEYAASIKTAAVPSVSGSAPRTTAPTPAAPHRDAGDVPHPILPQGRLFRSSISRTRPDTHPRRTDDRNESSDPFITAPPRRANRLPDPNRRNSHSVRTLPISTWTAVHSASIIRRGLRLRFARRPSRRRYSCAPSSQCVRWTRAPKTVWT